MEARPRQSVRPLSHKILTPRNRVDGKGGTHDSRGIAKLRNAIIGKKWSSSLPKAPTSPARTSGRRSEEGKNPFGKKRLHKKD